MAPLWRTRPLTDRGSAPAIHNAGRTEWREAIGFCLLSPTFRRTGDLAWRVSAFPGAGRYSRLTSRRLARVSPSI